ncbi:hypothetical protein LZ30DRAFT_687428 [Colletotrichum cereale]|nr:hypothetical protein LZ30DRAFT_687428 [Colletotrichum cereale]
MVCGGGGAIGTEQARLKLTLSWPAAQHDLSLSMCLAECKVTLALYLMTLFIHYCLSPPFTSLTTLIRSLRRFCTATSLPISQATMSNATYRPLTRGRDLLDLGLVDSKSTEDGGAVPGVLQGPSTGLAVDRSPSLRFSSAREPLVLTVLQSLRAAVVS